MTDDYSSYERLRSEGAPAEQVYRVVIQDGLDEIAAIRIIRKVFDLDLVQAKEVMARAEGAGGLEEYQARFGEALEKIADHEKD